MYLCSCKELGVAACSTSSLRRREYVLFEIVLYVHGVFYLYRWLIFAFVFYTIVYLFAIVVLYA